MVLNFIEGGKKMKVTNHRSPKNVKYTDINNKSQNICIMLSGGSYTYDKPLLYYATMLMIENQFDIVHAISVDQEAAHNARGTELMEQVKKELRQYEVVFSPSTYAERNREV